MKSALRGSAKLNWWSGRLIEKWDGITVRGGRVAELSLPNRGLDGTIPAGLGDLSALEVLDLSDNSLTGTIPSELGNLSNLEKMYLSSNQLTGCIPQTLGSIPNNDFDDLGLLFCDDQARRPQ